jgi:hypothetical protein
MHVRNQVTKVTKVVTYLIAKNKTVRLFKLLLL